MPRKSSEQPSAEPRMVAVDNIVGLAEIAKRTGSTPHAVWNWTNRYDENHPFPKPIATASGRPVYDWAEVEEWNKNWARSKGGWHTHRSQREEKAPRRQFMEGDDDGTRPSRAKKAAPRKRAAAKSTTKSKPAEKVASVTPIRRARRSRAKA